MKKIAMLLALVCTPVAFAETPPADKTADKAPAGDTTTAKDTKDAPKTTTKATTKKATSKSTKTPAKTKDAPKTDKEPAKS